MQTSIQIVYSEIYVLFMQLVMITFQQEVTFGIGYTNTCQRVYVMRGWLIHPGSIQTEYSWTQFSKTAVLQINQLDLWPLSSPTTF